MGNLETGVRSTKREVFYQDTSLFGDQRQVDQALDTIANTVQVPRDSLLICSSAKGLAFGTLVYEDEKSMIIDYRLKQMSVEMSVSGGYIMHRRPRNILIVEKEAVFDRLVQLYDEISVFFPDLLIVTGKGYPCLWTLKFVSWLNCEVGVDHKKRIMILVDYDPYGLLIAAQYKRGSNLPADKLNTKCDGLEFVGITREQIDNFTFTSFDCSRHLLNKRELKILDSLIEKDQDWPELVSMARQQRESGFGAEIESVYQRDPVNLRLLLQEISMELRDIKPLNL